MLLVVFGAGSSFDSAPARPVSEFNLPERPPLANDLFADGPFFADAITYFPRCQPIVPYLQQIPETTSLEAQLQQLQTEASEYPERHRQIAAIRYYLQFRLLQCERQWFSAIKGITNYKTLLDQIQRRLQSNEQVCLVTFNYDRMLEQALTSVNVSVANFPSYVAHPQWKLIKLHGSVHWAREVETPINDVISRGDWDIVKELIESAMTVKFSNRFRINENLPIAKDGNIALSPAIAVPLIEKEEFECPPDHLDALRTFLPTVKKVVVIGWRGSERHFLRMLAEHMRHPIEGIFVCGSKDAAQLPIDNLRRAGVTGTLRALDSGFTKFVKLREIDKFL